MKNAPFLGLLGSVAALAMIASCGSSSDSTDESGGTGGSAASSGSGGTAGGTGGTSASGGAAGAGATAGTGTGATGGTGATAGTGGSDPGDASLDVNFTYDAPPVDGSLNQDSACATTIAEAQLMPLDIYFMLDRSGSMGTDCNVGQTTASKWCRSINSIAGYLQDPSAAGNQAAIQYFPISGGACSGAGYSTPAVGLGILPGHATAIINSMNSMNASGGTPTEGGLRGLTQFTAVAQAPGRIMIGILITDGNPNGCNGSTTFLRGLREAHFQATGIRIFTIGMTGATYANIEAIASGGGVVPHNNFCGTTPPCHHYDVKDGDPTAFVAALKEIQQAAVSCQFQMPVTDAGVIDIDQVKIEYTPSATGVAEEIGRVSDATQCGAAGGWYYDDNTNPSFINLCDATCTVVQADPTAKIQVLLGCLGS